MPTCCVYNCVSCSSATNSCQTFALPPETSPKLRQEWLNRINRKNFNPTDSARVCILHFSKDAFIPDEENKDGSGRQRKKPRLKPLAIPTLNMKPSIKRRTSTDRLPLIWPCRQTDDHPYAQPPKREKLEAEATEENTEQLGHDHSYNNPADFVDNEVYLDCLLCNYLQKYSA